MRKRREIRRRGARLECVWLLHVGMSPWVCWRLDLPAIVKGHAKQDRKGVGSCVEEKAGQIWLSYVVWKIDVDDGG